MRVIKMARKYLPLSGGGGRTYGRNQVGAVATAEVVLYHLSTSPSSGYGLFECQAKTDLPTAGQYESLQPLCDNNVLINPSTVTITVQFLASGWHDWLCRGKHSFRRSGETGALALPDTGRLLEARHAAAEGGNPRSGMAIPIRLRDLHLWLSSPLPESPRTPGPTCRRT